MDDSELTRIVDGAIERVMRRRLTRRSRRARTLSDDERAQLARHAKDFAGGNADIAQTIEKKLLAPQIEKWVDEQRPAQPAP